MTAAESLTPDAVQIRWDTEILTTASVSDDAGAHWVCRTRHSGWECDCTEDGDCCHILATRQVTGK
jgi:hypothetical protein